MSKEICKEISQSMINFSYHLVMLHQSDDHIKHLYIVKNKEFFIILKQREREVHQIVDFSLEEITRLRMATYRNQTLTSFSQIKKK